MFLGI
jgi:hypothetical protein